MNVIPCFSIFLFLANISYARPVEDVGFEKVIGSFVGVRHMSSVIKNLPQTNEESQTLNDVTKLLRIPPGDLIVEGKIRLFKETEITGYGQHQNGAPMAITVDNYYAQKGEIYKLVFISSLLRNHKAELDTLKTFIQDDSEFLDKVEANDFNFNVKNLKQLIRDYNIKHFEGVGNTPYTVESPVTFYTTVKSKIRETLILKVNDSIEYKIHPKYPTPVQLAASVSRPSKVCLISSTGTWCEIMSPVPLETLYYELNYSPSDKSFEIEKRSVKSFKAFMQMHVLKKLR